ncbi:hypothetical protein ACFE04_017247 [Oxalis oulophora]
MSVGAKRLFSAQEKSSFGVVFHRVDSSFILALSSWFNGVFHPRLIEATAIREALSWIKHHFSGNGVIFNDCQDVVHVVQSNTLDLSEFEKVIDDCHTLLLQHSNVSVSWINREANIEAHCLARVSINTSCFCIWDVNIPDCMIQLC